MNEVDFALVIAAVPLAGYGVFLGGRAFERRIAKRAITQIVHNAMSSTTAISEAMMSIVRKRCPDVPNQELIQEMVNACAGVGIQAVAMDPETKQVVRPTVEVKSNDNKAE